MKTWSRCRGNVVACPALLFLQNYASNMAQDTKTDLCRLIQLVELDKKLEQVRIFFYDYRWDFSLLKLDSF